MKKIKHKSEVITCRLKTLGMKEIAEKYPDKVVEARVENGKPVLELTTCRIKYVTSEYL